MLISDLYIIPGISLLLSLVSLHQCFPSVESIFLEVTEMSWQTSGPGEDRRSRREGYIHAGNKESEARGGHDRAERAQ